MSNELKHYGIPGMKKGVRRWQNEDGSLTAAGRQRYGIGQYTDTGTGNRSRGGSLDSYIKTSSTRNRNRQAMQEANMDRIKAQRAAQETRARKEAYDRQRKRTSAQQRGAGYSEAVPYSVRSTGGNDTKRPGWLSRTATRIGRTVSNAWNTVSSRVRSGASKAVDRVKKTFSRAGLRNQATFASFAAKRASDRVKSVASNAWSKVSSMFSRKKTKQAGRTATGFSLSGKKR